MDNKRNNFFSEKQTWGTCEELLLACAVHRYGAENWNSVAREVQKRSSTSQHQRLTPFSCQQKYNDLRRRFSHGQIQNYSEDHAPWLDELKRLRVAELKREVELHDLSILSLQLKVERLTEEREQSLTENRKNETGISDLERTGEDDSKLLTDKPVTGEESDRENWSVNESNFTDPRAEDVEKQPTEPASDEPQENKPTGEDSCNGSCGSAAKEPARNSGDLVESVAESKGVGEERSTKERESGSDVQSSSTASLSREDAEKGEKPDEPDNEEEDQSPANKRVCVESQPLVDCLEILRSHKLGFIFERLGTQGEDQYRSLIRQHIDLETIRMRLQANWYSGCNSSFFRDLLVLFNNAILSFGKKSSESIAAIELRQVVLKEMALKIPNPNLLLKKQEQSLVSPAPQNLKSDVESTDSLPTKPNISAPLTACRKRSSIRVKGSASVSSSGADNKREQTATLIAKKPDLDRKQSDKSSVKADHEHQVTTKKRTRERLVSSSRNSSSKNSRTETNKIPKNVVDYSSQKEVTDYKKSEVKDEKEKKNKVHADAKKRSASNFSGRTKRSSPSDNGPLLGTLKSSVITSDKGAEKNKKSSKSDSRRDQNSLKNLGGKRGKERESPPKRNLGRQKRAAASAPPPQASGRRSNGREGSESASGRARKRSKK